MLTFKFPIYNIRVPIACSKALITLHRQLYELVYCLIRGLTTRIENFNFPYARDAMWDRLKQRLSEHNLHFAIVVNIDR